jgi:FixJ family two-component response regulator
MNRCTNDGSPTVVVIEDDQSVREALRGLLESVGLTTRTYGSVQEFMAADVPGHAGCLVVDIRLPGQSGLEFSETLARGDTPRSVVLISAHVDVPMAVRAMKAGAIDVLTKPVREQDLLEAVHRAITQDASRRSEMKQRAELRLKYTTLTERERQIMSQVVLGLQNKQIAADLEIAEATVKLHRGQVMRKMEAGSVVELARMADLLGNPDTSNQYR